MIDLPPGWTPDVEALTEAAMTLIWNAYPGYSADVFPESELEPAVRANVRLAVEVIRRGRAPAFDELTDGRGLGARRAGQGVPLESVIQAYRSTERTILLSLFSSAHEWPAGVTTRYADLALSTFDLLTDEMINAYRETSSAIEAARSRIESDLVGAIAHGVEIASADLERWSQALDLVPTIPYVSFAIAGRAPLDALDMQKLRRRLIVTLQPHVVGPVLFADVGDVVLGLSALRSSLDDVTAVLTVTINAVAPGAVAGVGCVAPSLHEASESCRQSQEAAVIASRRRESVVLVRYDDVLVDVLLDSQPRLASQLVTSRLGELSANPALVSTIRALVDANLSQSGAARRLFVHVNTVAHRMQRIRGLTGLDPLRATDLFELHLALRARDLNLGPVGTTAS